MPRPPGGGGFAIPPQSCSRSTTARSWETASNELAQARVHDLATAFCPPEFTIAELREVYEAIWNERLDPRNFSRKVLSAADFVTPTNGTTTRGGGRPARLYRAGQASELAPLHRQTG